MNWNAKKVVVTGAGGFIGSHLVEQLVSSGAEVTAVVRYNSRGDDGNLEYVPDDVRSQVRVSRIELTDLDAVRQALRGQQVVFNLAAFVGIPYSYANPQDVVANNVGSTLNVLLAGRDHGVERIVQTSTSEVYGSARQVPIPETHPLQPQSPYSASKIATDNIALSFWHTYQLPVTVVRPFNTFGPRQSARAVIPSVICQALAGSNIRMGATTPTRDFTYVTDTVQGFMRAATAERAVGEVVNLGTGREVTIADTVQAILDVVGGEARIVPDEQRLRPATSEVVRLCADISKARALIGYAPEVTLEEGLRRTAEWIAAHRDLYKPDAYNV